eukprot:TRINITY_DN50285_c0_g1_i1.p2 TRINITY_DN50285_c0_g1~~TRINITY_DN50285_c0_g1_i1.p2  ORF type:complete len:254 (-),score=67.64 TRINITY_DN50285_c0_g1_i1:38-799(-)
MPPTARDSFTLLKRFPVVLLRWVKQQVRNWPVTVPYLEGGLSGETVDLGHAQQPDFPRTVASHALVSGTVLFQSLEGDLVGHPIGIAQVVLRLGEEGVVQVRGIVVPEAQGQVFQGPPVRSGHEHATLVAPGPGNLGHGLEKLGVPVLLLVHPEETERQVVHVLGLDAVGLEGLGQHAAVVAVDERSIQALPPDADLALGEAALEVGLAQCVNPLVPAGAVSYTHLTLTTKRIVQISVVYASIKKKKIRNTTT